MKGTRLPTISKIIEQGGGLESLTDRHYIRIENEPYMRLVIERIGTFEKMPVVSIAHYYEQDGDAMRDPEMTFAISVWPDFKTGKKVPYYHPISFLQDGGAAFHQEAMFHENGKPMVRRDIYADLCSFARTWDRNIKEQRFLEAMAREQAFLETVKEQTT